MAIAIFRHQIENLTASDSKLVPYKVCLWSCWRRAFREWLGLPLISLIWVPRVTHAAPLGLATGPLPEMTLISRWNGLGRKG